MLKLPPGFNILQPIVSTEDVFQGYNVSCPGCGQDHFIRTVPATNSMTGEEYPWWDFDGNLWAPTFSPSIDSWIGDKEAPTWRCHFFIENGLFRFQGDCTHEFAGKRDIPAIPYKHSYYED